MWIRLLKSHLIHTGKKLPIGKVMAFDRSYGLELIGKEIGELYTGTLPPKKMKTEFFKPKN